MIYLLKIGILVVVSQGCATIKEKPIFKVYVSPDPPKTFFERTFPRAEPAWPSNQMDKSGLEPLQVA